MTFTKSSLPGADGGSREFVFVLEQSLGHIAHGANLERAVIGQGDISATVIRIEPGGKRLAGRLPVVGSWSFEASTSARIGLRQRLAEGPAHAMFIHSQVATLFSVGAMRTIPTVISLDATPINYDSVGESYGHRRQGAGLEWGKRHLNRRAFMASRAIVTFSKWAADSVVDDYGVPPDRVHVVRPGVDLNKFRPGVAGGRAAGSVRPVRILFVGGDFRRKGGNELLAAMRQLGDSAELDIVTGARPPIARELPVRVHVGLGHDSDEFFELYRRADIFVLPSRGDCSPHVISEALASGVPVIACAVGAVGEVVVDGYNGLLVPPGAPDRLADALKLLIARPDLRRSMGQRGRRMAQQDHDADRNAAAIFELMRQLAMTGIQEGRVPCPTP